MFKNISHIGIAVRNLMQSADTFHKLFNIKDIHVEAVPDQKVNVAVFNVGGNRIELLEGSSQDSPISEFTEKKGEGIHHISFEVDDIEKEISRLKSEGFRLIDEKPRNGADGNMVAFLHPKTTNGVLIELTQKILHGR